MALTCSLPTVQYEDFEFIDCSTINIAYNRRGDATVSLSVVSTYDHIINDYTNLEFGGVHFSLYIRDVTITTIPGTQVYVYQLTMLGIGC